MTIDELIEEYKLMASICDNIDYLEKTSVKAASKAVTRMYQIVDTINSNFGENGTAEFVKLVAYTKHRTDLWASVQMLEKMNIDQATEKSALAVIKEEAKTSPGMEYWLNDYLAKKKSSTR